MPKLKPSQGTRGRSVDDGSGSPDTGPEAQFQFPVLPSVDPKTLCIDLHGLSKSATRISSLQAAEIRGAHVVKPRAQL